MATISLEHDAPARWGSGPRVPNAHLFQADGHPMLFAVDGGRLFKLDSPLAELLASAVGHGDADRVTLFMAAAGMSSDPAEAESPPASVPLRALSLSVAQKCNLGCTYCYAQQGGFGAAGRGMPRDVARKAVDRLVESCAPGETVSLAFLGGEPLANRAVLRDATRYAAHKCASAGIGTRFAVTTNATLLTSEDVEFFKTFRFTVTISIDGDREAHDAQRPFKNGRGSYDRVVERAQLLLARSAGRCRVLARVTVTPRNLCLPEILEQFVLLGFDGVLFSPVLNAPSGIDQMGAENFETLLRQMTTCGDACRDALARGRRYPFANFLDTLRRIHHARRDAYPCGAGGNYLGVSADGGLFACHRFVNDELGAMGDVGSGIDGERRRIWLLERNVHSQKPCGTCWARHLCGGGCHYEVLHAGRGACDYIRGWLHYCLSAYANLARAEPSTLECILKG